MGSIALSGAQLPGQGLRRQDQHDGQLVQPVHRCQLHQSLHVRAADLRLAIDVFATRTDYQEESSYDSRAIGFALRTGFRLDEYSTLRFTYGLSYREVDGINYASAAPAVIESEGKTLKSFLGSTYTWDNLDNPNRPSNGFRGQLVGEFAGLGGDVYFGSIEAHAWYFIPIYEEQVVLKLEGNAGYIHGFNGKTVPLQDRFYKGGDSFRGFRQLGCRRVPGGRTTAILTRSAPRPMRSVRSKWSSRSACRRNGESKAQSSRTSVRCSARRTNPVASRWNRRLRLSAPIPTMRMLVTSTSTSKLPRFGRCRRRLAVALRPAAFRGGLSAAQGKTSTRRSGSASRSAPGSRSERRHFGQHFHGRPGGPSFRIQEMAS